MRRNELLILAAMLAAAVCVSAQVVAPAEIRDPRLRELQNKHLPDLEKASQGISRRQFPYRFYMSRKLDLTEEQQRAADQRSIRFDTFRDQTVLEVTGNYYASYSATLLDKGERARRTLLDVVAPILQAAIPAVKDEAAVQGFAVEISQHVRRNMLGVTVEAVEHVAFVFPRTAAPGFLAASTSEEQEAALAHGALYVNAEPAPGWEKQAEAWPPSEASPASQKTASTQPAARADRPAITPDLLREKQASYQPALDKLAKELDQDAHFVSYAPPAFVAFHDGAYLQLSVSTTLAEKDPGSRYRAAALAFDEHIARLIRPVLARLPGRSGFDGVDFSASVRSAGESAPSLAVEFVFPSAALDCYEKYDCTGQQLIAESFVLINGERASLDLQTAEAGASK